MGIRVSFCQHCRALMLPVLFLFTSLGITLPEEVQSSEVDALGQRQPLLLFTVPRDHSISWINL